MVKKKFIVVLAIFIFVIIFISPILFQEGNPIPIINAIIKLNSSDMNFVQISDNPDRYISKAGEGNDILIQYMDGEGWIFIEQNGSAYFFLKDNSELMVKSTKYTGKYIIWTWSD
jgi:hypothetical protein